MIAYKKIDSKWFETAVDVEVRADHPDQVIRTTRRMSAEGEIIFVVPDEKIANRVKGILGDMKKVPA